VGATKWFIQRPFLLRAAGYGLVGGLFASLLLWILSDYAQNKIVDIKALHDQNDFITLVSILILSGIVLTVVSTLLSIQKYLKMSLDELY
jgi:cell division transport system permease protein